jgi:sugar phosphate isomerase/epimerase
MNEMKRSGFIVKLKKSVVISGLEPSTRDDARAFAQALDKLSGLNIKTIEYMAPLPQVPQRGELLAERGFSGIFLAAGYQKMNRDNLSSLSGDIRSHAMDECRRYIDAAMASSAEAVLVTSGAFPQDQASVPKAWDALETSLRALIAHCVGRVRLLLEPGDRTVDARQLAGPTGEVVSLMKRIGMPLRLFGLTMDTSHIAQLGEDVFEALRVSEPYCDHIHLANCVLDPSSPLYGDKHPVFNHPGASYTSNDLQNIAAFITGHSIHSGLTMAVEVISRDQTLWKIFDFVVKGEPWFFQ